MAVDEIDALLAERLQCKFRRDFQRADALQEELFSMGVRVHDGLKLWRDDGGGFGDEMGRNAKAGRQRNSRQDRATYTMDADSDEVDEMMCERARQALGLARCSKSLQTAWLH